jgi:hypothetical protein
MSAFNTDPDRSVSEILDDIRTNAAGSTSQNNKLGFVLAPFSALLVKLSKDAEATAASVNAKTHQLIILARWLIVLTVVLIILTIPWMFLADLAKQLGLVDLARQLGDLIRRLLARTS